MLSSLDLVYMTEQVRHGRVSMYTVYAITICLMHAISVNLYALSTILFYNILAKCIVHIPNSSNT